MSDVNIVDKLLKGDTAAIYSLKQEMKRIIKAGGVGYDVLSESGLIEFVRKGIINYRDEDETSKCRLAEGGVEQSINEEMTEKLEISLYAYETCLKVLQKEEEIRKFIGPSFRVEQISFKPLTEYEDFENVPPFGEEALLMLLPGNPGVFLSEKGLRVNEYPMCYRKLAYQTAYMQFYYPQLEKAKREIENMREYPNVLGIELDLHVSRAAMYRSEKEIALVMRQKGEYDFAGFQTVTDLGIAASEMGKSIRSIVKKADGYIDFETAAVVICLPTEYMNKKEAVQWLENLKEKAKNDAQAALSLQIYEALDLEEAGTYECVKKAAELIGADNAELVPRPLCIVAAYEHMDKENVLIGYEYGLVFDWNKEYFSVTVVSRLGDKDVNILNQRVLHMPAGDFDIMQDLRRELDITIEMSGYEPDSLKLYFDKSEDIDASGEEKRYRYYLYENVIRQMIRCKYANLIMDDTMFSDKVTRYFEGFFECEVMNHLMDKVEDIIRRVLSGVQLEFSDITKVYFAGEWGNYEYLHNQLDRMCARDVRICIMEDTAHAAVKGAAYLAKDRCI